MFGLLLLVAMLVATVMLASCGDDSSSSGGGGGTSSGNSGGGSSSSSTGGSTTCFATEEGLAVAYIDALKAQLSPDEAANVLFASEAQYLKARSEFASAPAPCSTTKPLWWQQDYSVQRADFEERWAGRLAHRDWSSCALEGSVPSDCDPNAGCAPFVCGELTTWGEDTNAVFTCTDGLGTESEALWGLSELEGCWFLSEDPS